MTVQIGSDDTLYVWLSAAVRRYCRLHLMQSAPMYIEGERSVQAPAELEVPPQGASAELEGLTGVWAAVKCLVSVGASNVDLIKAHARCSNPAGL